jgi:hypothetical protein
MAYSKLDSDLFVNGHLTSITAALPSGTVTNAMVNASAAIASTKVQQDTILTYWQVDGSDIVDAIAGIYIARQAATIVAIEVACIDGPSGGGGDPKHFHVDLLKGNTGTPNGATVLAAAIDYVNGTADGTVMAGTISSATLADGDYLIVSVDAVGADNTQGQGLIVTVTIRETPLS